MPQAKHSWYDWDDFEEAAARALWSDTYISEVENLVEEDKSPEARAAYRELAPGPDGKWDPLIPEPIPASVKKQAKKFTKDLRSKISEEDLREVASKVDADTAGWYAMMQALGHGVGWHDYDIDADPNIHTGADVGVYNDAYEAVNQALEDADIHLDRK